MPGYDGPGEELVVPFEGDPLVIKKLARKKRREERKAARRLGITTDQYRKQHRAEEPAGVSSTVTRRTTAKVATYIAKDEYRERLIAELALPLHEDPENEHWLGFSIDEIQKEAPDPKDGAKLVIKRVAEYAPYVALDAIVIFRERLLGIGPWIQK